MTPEEAEALAEATLAAIDEDSPCHPDCHPSECAGAADRERVASDLAGVDHHGLAEDGTCGRCGTYGCSDVRRYADGLRRTAALYGVTG